jgi:hypothetical protein
LGGNPVSDSDSEDDSDTESEIGLEDLDFDEDEEKQKEAELVTFSEPLREAQVNAVALEKASQTTKRHRGKSTGKSLSTLNRIARANAMLAKSGQKCISSFFIGRKEAAMHNLDEDVEMLTAVAEAEMDDEMTVAFQVSTFSVSGANVMLTCTSEQ